MSSYLHNIKNLIYILNIKKKKFLYLLLLIILSSFIEIIGLSLIAPYVSKIFELNLLTNLPYFNFLRYDQDNFIYFASAAIIVLFFLKGIISIFIRWYIAKFSYREFAKLQARVLLAYQKMSYQEFLKRNQTVYIRNIRELCSHTLTSVELALRAVAEIIIIIFIFIFLIYLDFKIFLYISLIILPIFLIYEKFLKKINFKLGLLRIDAIKGIYKNAVNGINGSKEIKFLFKGSFFRENLLNNAKIAADAQAKSLLISDSPRYVFEFALAAFSIIALFLLSISNQDLDLYLPIISVFLLAGIRVLPSISLIVNSLNRIGHYLPSVDIILRDLKNFEDTEIKNKKNYQNDFEEIKTIELRNIDFKYDNSDSEVFKNLNFEINKNECVGIVGPSGSGKTTLIDIILGLLSPSNGEIFINGKILKNHVSILEGNIAYLPQEPMVLEESIETNITLEKDKTKINSKKLSQSIIYSNFEEVLAKLTSGLNTMIGDKGVRLSGGQNKRLALARVLYHGKNFLILDEATSSLDKESENYIAEQIKILKGNYTIILISHQLNLLKHCDKIYKIDNKKVIFN